MWHSLKPVFRLSLELQSHLALQGPTDEKGYESQELDYPRMARDRHERMSLLFLQLLTKIDPLGMSFFRLSSLPTR